MNRGAYPHLFSLFDITLFSLQCARIPQLCRQMLQRKHSHKRRRTVYNTASQHSAETRLRKWNRRCENVRTIIIGILATRNLRVLPNRKFTSTAYQWLQYIHHWASADWAAEQGVASLNRTVYGNLSLPNDNWDRLRWNSKYCLDPSIYNVAISKIQGGTKLIHTKRTSPKTRRQVNKSLGKTPKKNSLMHCANPQSFLLCVKWVKEIRFDASWAGTDTHQWSTQWSDVRTFWNNALLAIGMEWN